MKDIKVKLSNCAQENLKQVIRVNYVGELAVDTGGPK